MIGLNERERIALIILGAIACAGLGVLAWQQRRPAITVVPGSPPPYAQWDAALTTAKRIDLNRASAEELERLPRIGPGLAQRIVAYRQAHGPFTEPDELLAVDGIGRQTLQAMREYVTIEPSS